MQIIIDIPEQLIELAQKELIMGGDMPTIANAISNGVVLPKGHGDLIDRNELKKVINQFECYDQVLDAPAIVKADKPKRGCSACPCSGSLIDGYKDCPDAYTKQSQYCGFNNKE